MGLFETRDRIEAAITARHPGCDARVDTQLFAGHTAIELQVRAWVAGVAWERSPLVVQHILAARYRNAQEGLGDLARALGVPLLPSDDPRDAHIAALEKRVRELEQTLVARDVALRAVVHGAREAA